MLRNLGTKWSVVWRQGNKIHEEFFDDYWEASEFLDKKEEQKRNYIISRIMREKRKAENKETVYIKTKRE